MDQPGTQIPACLKTRPEVLRQSDEHVCDSGHAREGALSLECYLRVVKHTEKDAAHTVRGHRHPRESGGPQNLPPSNPLKRSGLGKAARICQKQVIHNFLSTLFLDLNVRHFSHHVRPVLISEACVLFFEQPYTNLQPPVQPDGLICNLHGPDTRLESSPAIDVVFCLYL